jgi:hypothetical protein
MTEINHRRGTRRSYPSLRGKRATRLGGKKHGSLPTGEKPWAYIDKSMSGWIGKAPLAGVRAGASIANDFTSGHRGMARSVRGAKKFVRSRVRFHENAATRKLARDAAPEYGES